MSESAAADGFEAFDFSTFDPDKIIEGALTLVEGCVGKDELRAEFIAGLRSGLAEICGQDPDLTEAKYRALVDAADSGDPDAQRALGREKSDRRRFNHRVTALIDIVIAIVRVLVVCKCFAKQSAGEEATPDENTWKEFGKPLSQAAIDLLGGVLTLLVDGADPEFLRGFVDKLRNPDAALKAHTEAMTQRLGRARGMTDDELAADIEYRKQKSADAREDRDKASDGKLFSKEATRILGALCGLIDGALALRDAWFTVFPSDLAGLWIVSEAADEHLGYQLELEAGEQPRVFEGTLRAHGLPGAGGTDPVTEDKARITIEAGGSLKDGSPPLSLRWSGIAPTQPVIPTSTDAAFASSGVRHESLAFHSTRRLEGTVALCHGNPGQPLGLHRPARLTAALGLARAALSLLGSIPAVLPTPLRKKWTAGFLRQVELPLAEMGQSLRKLPLGQRIADHVVFEFDPAGEPCVTLGFQGADEDASLCATWDLEPIVEGLLEEPKPHERSPWVPSGLEGSISYGWAGLTIAWESWNEADDPDAGNQGVEDNPIFAQVLASLGISKETFDAEAAEKGFRYDVLEPEIDFDPADPTSSALVLHVALYFGTLITEEGTAPWPLHSKITLSFSLAPQSVLTLFPQIRALLFAWNVGWMLGTYTRMILLQFEWYQNLEQGWQSTLANKLWDTAYFRERNRLTQSFAKLHPVHITYPEMVLASLKAGNHAWLERRSEQGQPPDYWKHLRFWEEYREHFVHRLSVIRQREQDAGNLTALALTADQPGHRWYMDAEVEARVYLFLLHGQRGRWTRDKLEQFLLETYNRKEISLARCKWLQLLLSARSGGSKGIPQQLKALRGLALQMTRASHLKPFEVAEWQRLADGLGTLEAEFFIRCITSPPPSTVYFSERRSFFDPRNGKGKREGVLVIQTREASRRVRVVLLDPRLETGLRARPISRHDVTTQNHETTLAIDRLTVLKDYIAAREGDLGVIVHLETIAPSSRLA
ncbi:MAG: hypothetical protein ACYTFT_09345, partial [Planctomycetota bacterium]